MVPISRDQEAVMFVSLLRKRSRSLRTVIDPPTLFSACQPWQATGSDAVQDCSQSNRTSSGMV